MNRPKSGPQLMSVLVGWTQLRPGPVLGLFSSLLSKHVAVIWPACGSDLTNRSGPPKCHHSTQFVSGTILLSGIPYPSFDFNHPPDLSLPLYHVTYAEIKNLKKHWCWLWKNRTLSLEWAPTICRIIQHLPSRTMALYVPFSFSPLEKCNVSLSFSASSSNGSLSVQIWLPSLPHTHTHTHIHTTYIIGGETNYSRTGELFCLVHPCLSFFCCCCSLSPPPSLTPSLPPTDGVF